MSHLTHLYSKCPLLLARMQEDAREGVFDWDWPVTSWQSLHYMSKLAGRPIRREEGITRTMDEIERKLTQEALVV